MSAVKMSVASTHALQAAKKFGVPEADITLRQDEDVLDTWCAAALHALGLIWKVFVGHLPDFHLWLAGQHQGPAGLLSVAGARDRFDCAMPHHRSHRQVTTLSSSGWRAW